MISWQKVGGGQGTVRVHQVAVTMTLTRAAQSTILTPVHEKGVLLWFALSCSLHASQAGTSSWWRHFASRYCVIAQMLPHAFRWRAT